MCTSKTVISMWLIDEIFTREHRLSLHINYLTGNERSVSLVMDSDLVVFFNPQSYTGKRSAAKMPNCKGIAYETFPSITTSISRHTYRIDDLKYITSLVKNVNKRINRVKNLVNSKKVLI